MRTLSGKARRLFAAHTKRAVLVTSVALGLVWSPGLRAGVLSESDLKQAEGLKPLFANLMTNLVETAKRPDVPNGDIVCINSTIRELLQISDELASYEYLITMEKDLTDVGDDNPLRGVVKFAVDKTNVILTSERKRLVQLSEQCSKNPVGFGKAQEALRVIDTTTGILSSIRERL
ncbi:hypothetical protein FBZ93_12372 [Bradyrhizobium macuxiense]|uniref:Uncharacterized protein n=1 Tax=Bradyrhizobium macuxiense TaxID=1755647 RepID=A0A560KV53_9BRAD|nr:hypothetical protein [Bradyrhizobium macuxiense]TWB87141.1 hypothetical protein FBZ93_12372 [Bradyrhizobium macuxiense]